MADSRSIELQTKRLILRRLSIEDAEAMAEYRSLPDVARYQSWEQFTLEDASALINRQLEYAPNEPGTWLQLGLEKKVTGELIGDCGIHFLKEDPKQVELGITISPDQQGRGLAAEAIECVLGYVFEDLDKHRVFATTDASNKFAAALMQRLGFRKEAHFVENIWFKGAWGSEFQFAMLKREWQARVGVPRLLSFAKPTT